MTDNYKVHCLFCMTDGNLQMHAHRVDNKLVGFIFLCDKCANEMKDVDVTMGWVKKNKESTKVL